MKIVESPVGCVTGARALLVVAGIVAGSVTGYAQAPADKDKSSAVASVKAAQPVARKPLPPRTFDRWVELQTASFSGRYRYVETSGDVVSATQVQDSVALKARLKLDPKGRFSVNAGVATGSTFTGGWNNTGVGTGDTVNMWYLKQLFVAAVHAKGLELSCGGLAFVRGSMSPAWEELSVQVAARTAAIASGQSRRVRDLTPETVGRVTRLVRAIERHPDGRLTLDRLARSADLSPYHFLRTFERVTGVTPHQYVLRARLREAATRLTADSPTVLDVALDCGFGDVSNFNRAFRAEFGVAPQPFREGVRRGRLLVPGSGFGVQVRGSRFGSKS